MLKAAPKSPDLNINLLSNESSSVSSGNAVHWILTVGRYLVIVTEVIALGTFLFGVWLSKEKNDLKVSIKSKQSQVDEYQNCNSDAFCEDRFRKTQNQIAQVSLIRSSRFQENQVLTEFAKLLPLNLNLESLSSDGKIITFSGNFPDPQQLQTMINSFNTSSKISNLDITALSQENDKSYKFTASTVINKTGFSNK
ncbi:MAG: hypothetical protein Q7T50_02015 [Candidatus Magasanikbacteria bacterium]|nr:hypothetical protein [Candidatus Magasanikbacteria bacterium]